MELEILKTIILVGVTVLLYTIECIFPFFESWTKKSTHALQNFGIVAINAVIVNLFFAALLFSFTDTSWGLFNRLNLSWGVELALTILIMDFLTYWMHVAFHMIPFMWKFHRMHHSDTKMDVTSGLRFHIGEHIITMAARACVFALCAIEIEFLIIYEIIFLANVLFHHANISIGDRADKIFRIVFTSPDMHKVHHSNIPSETNSNYTSLFSVWDRIFGTFKLVKNPKKIVFGLKGWDNEQSIWAMLKTPFRK